jgi:hypothetical protein
MIKRRRTGITMAKRRRTGITMAKGRQTGITRAKRRRAGIKVEATMGKTSLVNEFFRISYILFFRMYLTKYQNLRIGFQAYFKNIS